MQSGLIDTVVFKQYCLQPSISKRVIISTLPNKLLFKFLFFGNANICHFATYWSALSESNNFQDAQMKYVNINLHYNSLSNKLL